MPREGEFMYADERELIVEDPQGSQISREKRNPHRAAILASCTDFEQPWVIRVELWREVDLLTCRPNNNRAFEGIRSRRISSKRTLLCILVN